MPWCSSETRASKSLSSTAAPANLMCLPEGRIARGEPFDVNAQPCEIVVWDRIRKCSHQASTCMHALRTPNVLSLQRRPHSHFLQLLFAACRCIDRRRSGRPKARTHDAFVDPSGCLANVRRLDMRTRYQPASALIAHFGEQEGMCMESNITVPRLKHLSIIS